nr:hypothetical protein [Synergistaceae bacterium]
VLASYSPSSQAGAYFLNKQFAEGAGLDASGAAAFKPITYQTRESYVIPKERQIERVFRIGDKGFSYTPVAYGARFAGKQYSKLKGTRFYQEGTADEWLAYGLQRGLGEKPFTTAVGAGLYATSAAASTVTGGTATPLIVAALSTTGLGAVTYEFSKDYRGWKNPEAAAFMEQPRFVGAMQRTEYGGKDYFFGIIPGKERVRDMVKLTGYEQNLRRNLVAAGYEEGSSEFTQAVSAGIYNVRTRQFSYGAASVVGAESAANFLGSAGTKVFRPVAQKLFTGKVAQGMATRGLGWGSGGLLEGGFTEYIRQRSRSEEFNPKRIAAMSAFGGFTAGTVGIAVGSAAAFGGRSERIASEAANFLDAPAEQAGDFISAYGFGGSGMSSPVATFTPAPEPSRYQGPFIDISFSEVGGMRASPAPQRASQRTFSLQTTRTTLPTISVQNDVMSLSQAFSRSNSIIPSFSPSQSTVPATLPTTVPERAFVPAITPSTVPERSFVMDPVQVPEQSFVPDPVTEPVTVPTSPMPFMFPPGLGGRGFGGGRAGKRPQYKPSITALFGGLTTSKAGSTFTTGFDLRPVVQTSKKKGKKKKKSSPRDFFGAFF